MNIQISKEIAVKMYADMVKLQVMDTIFYEAQRQGRISFYATTTGEEAINIASAAGLNNNDFVFPQVTFYFLVHIIMNCFIIKSISIVNDLLLTILMQYREPGVLLWRGFSLQNLEISCLETNMIMEKEDRCLSFYLCET